MQYSIKQHNNTTAILSFEGSLIEQHGLPELMAQIAQNTNPDTINFIINLSGISNLNSSGLNVLLHLFTKSRNAGGETILTNLPQHLQQLLVVTKLNTIFTSAANIEEAIVLL